MSPGRRLRLSTITMYQQDYILKLLDLFFKSLDQWIHGTIEEKERTFLDFNEEMYRTFLKETPSFFREKDAGSIISYFEATYQGEERLARIEIFSELLCIEAENRPVFREQLSKLHALLVYIDADSRTFSFDRQKKLQRIQELLKEKR